MAGLVEIADRRPLVVHALGARKRGRESRQIWLRDGFGMGAAIAKAVRIGQWRAAAAPVAVILGMWRDVLLAVVGWRRPFGLTIVGMTTLGALRGFTRGSRQPLQRTRSGYLFTAHR